MAALNSGARRMTLQTNKDLALRFFDAMANGRIEQMDAMMTPDATWWIAPSTRFSGLYSKEEFLKLGADVAHQAAGQRSYEFDYITAEDERVSLAGRGILPLENGVAYRSEYHFLIFIRDGKISAAKEYLDSSQLNDIFGRPTPETTDA
jgi:ketosteroid isomerase-like protein